MPPVPCIDAGQFSHNVQGINKSQCVVACTSVCGLSQLDYITHCKDTMANHAIASCVEHTNAVLLACLAKPGKSLADLCLQSCLLACDLAQHVLLTQLEAFIPLELV